MDEEVEGPFGLNVVHDPPGATVDVIAVHGLGASPKHAWTRKIKDATGEYEVKWLEDSHLLPAAIPNARILTFGYESKWHKDASWQRRSLCGNQLLSALHARRQQEEETKNRPLIFIGHSFGGIVIEQAIVDANQHGGRFLYLSMSTIGVVFLGTPHRGTEAAKWGELIATSGQLLGFGSETRILQDLKKDSLSLVDLLHSFTLWLFRFSVPVVCFFEKHKTDYGKKTEYGKRWRISWKELVVEERSACIDGHRKVPVQTDHIKINKFTGLNDDAYRTVSTVLQEMVNGGNEKVQTRLNPRQIIENNSIVPKNHLECLQALFCSIDPRDARSAIHRTKGELIPGTCEWLLTQEKYSAWLVDENMSILWLLGGPGIGKTMLSSFLADELEKKVQMMPKAIFVYFFCDDNDVNRRKDTAILRGLMLQILRQLPGLFKYIQDDYNLQKQAMFDNFDTLWRIFLKMLEDSDGNKIFILLDALDECESLSRTNLLSAMTKLSDSSRTKGRFKLVVTSRPDADMDGDSTSSVYKNQVRIDSAKINTDLAKFIDVRMAKLPKTWPAAIITEVRDILVNKAGGTFLWVSLVLDNLSKGGPSRHVRQKLLELPPSLNAAYDRILERVDREWRDDVKLVLEWVVGAQRPLTIGELRVALGFSLASTKDNGLPSADDIDGLEDAVKFCGNLLYHDTETDTVNLYHQSVKDYLLDKRLRNHTALSEFSVSPEKTNLHIFEVCWRYVSSKEFDYGRSIVKNVDGCLSSTDIVSRSNSSITYKFLSYAVHEWVKHAAEIRQSLLSDKKWDSFALERSSTLRDHWLLEAAGVGQEPVILKLLEKGADIEVKSNHGMTALHWAAVKGHEAEVRLLLQKGADIEAKSNYGWTVLHWAAYEGHEVIVQLLLEKGANIEARSNDEWTVLHLAARKEHKAMVRLLLDKGADIEAKDNIGMTALRWAVHGGHKAVLRLLLDKGADIEAKSNYGWTVLHLAAYEGHEVIVQLLLEKGADIEAKDNDGWTVLHTAAFSGHEAVVQLLLEKGADIEAKGNDGWTALHSAAVSGHEVVLQLLLPKGADIEAKDNYGMTALHSAAVSEHEAVVRLLLEKGANIDAKSNDGRTALTIATSHGHEGAVQLLKSAQG